MGYITSGTSTAGWQKVIENDVLPAFGLEFSITNATEERPVNVGYVHFVMYNSGNGNRYVVYSNQVYSPGIYIPIYDTYRLITGAYDLWVNWNLSGTDYYIEKEL